MSVQIVRTFMVINAYQYFIDVKCKCLESTWYSHKSMHFFPAKRHCFFFVVVVVLRSLLKGKACTFTLTFLDQSVFGTKQNDWLTVLSQFRLLQCKLIWVFTVCQHNLRALPIKTKCTKILVVNLYIYIFFVIF